MRAEKFKVVLLQIYRFAVLAFIVWLAREQHVRFRIAGDRPVTVGEVQGVFTNAARLRPDHTERAGYHVLDLEGREIGYLARTLPQGNRIIGYSGVTDVLVLFDTALRVRGLKVRSTEDTPSHMEDIIADRKFLKKWNGMAWDDVAAMNLKKAGIEGVSGATMTSMAMAESVVHRLRVSSNALAARPPLRFEVRDYGLIGVTVLAGVMAFTRFGQRRRLRILFQIVLVGYVGLISGDLIAQSLLAGWAKSGVPWTTAPGLVLLVAAALLVPWATKKPLYCHQICPHGAVQEWLGRTRWKNRWHLSPSLAAGLRWLPGLLLAYVVLMVMLAVPADFAGLEPFDAYILLSAGGATVVVAIVGLVVSVFIPQAYCRYGCPTGALLEFVRSRGPHDGFSVRDVAAGMVAVAAWLLFWQFPLVNAWVRGVGG